jgi:predicted acylesterase/phospholipase RssA
MGRKRGRTKRVAIACQGGGSHSAFAAGVLRRLLAEERNRYEIVALSGTSGGAICALLVWYALLRNDRGEAVRLLESFWESVSASSPTEQVMNDLLVEASRMQSKVATPLITPYLYPEWGREALEEALEGLVDFGEIGRLVTASSPKLLVGAVEVLSGEFEVFRNAEVTAEKVLASCALPMLFRAVRLGDDKVYWDGLFSQNPPIRDFMREFPDATTKPDEIWLIQIKPPAPGARATVDLGDTKPARGDVGQPRAAPGDRLRQRGQRSAPVPPKRALQAHRGAQDRDALGDGCRFEDGSPPVFRPRDVHLRRGASRGVLKRGIVAYPLVI